VSLDDDIRRLGRLPLFERLDQEALKLLAFSAETKTLRRGDVLFRRGEKADSGYFIVSGAIALYVSTDGKSDAAAVVGAGSLVGEMALLVTTERQATAVVREPGDVLKIPRTLFQRILEEYPEAALAMRDFVSTRLTNFVTELQNSDAICGGEFIGSRR
jgi:CRP-like cAMP-binding protein